ncbi:unnamed protein product, partial [Rotaria sp. Silwood2]
INPVMAKQWQKQRNEVSRSTNETINDKNENNKHFILNKNKYNHISVLVESSASISTTRTVIERS